MTGLRRSRQASLPGAPQRLPRSGAHTGRRAAPTARQAWAAARGGGPGREPPWLRRGAVSVLAVVAAYQVTLWVFGNLRHFFALLFVAWLFAVSIEPIVEGLARRGVRRGAATGIVLVGIVVLVAGFIGVFGTLLVSQLIELVGALPDT